jgi:hypothetical protein
MWPASNTCSICGGDRFAGLLLPSIVKKRCLEEHRGLETAFRHAARWHQVNIELDYGVFDLILCSTVIQGERHENHVSKT